MSTMEEKKPRGPRRWFTADFKAEAVRLVLDEGVLATKVAQDLGISDSAIGAWVKQARIDRGQGKGGELATEERRELYELRRKVRQLEMEREILKKAAAFFAKENG